MSEAKPCLGCPGDTTPTKFRWHDGKYVSPKCADHIRKSLPERLKGYTQTVVEHRGRGAVVSGYGFHADYPDRKFVIKADVDAFIEDICGGSE